MGDYWRSMLAQEWRPTSRYSVAPWLVFYVVFLIYAFSQHGAFLFIDLANLVVHEGGHLLFGWFGPTLGLWGGTILQWLVPLLLAAISLAKDRRRLRVLLILLLRELAVHRDLHG